MLRRHSIKAASFPYGRRRCVMVTVPAWQQRCLTTGRIAPWYGSRMIRRADSIRLVRAVADAAAAYAPRPESTDASRPSAADRGPDTGFYVREVKAPALLTVRLAGPTALELPADAAPLQHLVARLIPPGARLTHTTIIDEPIGFGSTRTPPYDRLRERLNDIAPTARRADVCFYGCAGIDAGLAAVVFPSASLTVTADATTSLGYFPGDVDRLVIHAGQHRHLAGDFVVGADMPRFSAAEVIGGLLSYVPQARLRAVYTWEVDGDRATGGPNEIGGKQRQQLLVLYDRGSGSPVRAHLHVTDVISPTTGASWWGQALGSLGVDAVIIKSDSGGNAPAIPVYERWLSASRGVLLADSVCAPMQPGADWTGLGAGLGYGSALVRRFGVI